MIARRLFGCFSNTTLQPPNFRFRNAKAETSGNSDFTQALAQPLEKQFMAKKVKVRPPNSIVLITGDPDNAKFKDFESEKKTYLINSIQHHRRLPNVAGRADQHHTFLRSNSERPADFRKRSRYSVSLGRSVDHPSGKAA